MSDVRFKSIEASFQTQAPVSQEEAAELKTKVEESLVEIQQAKKYDEYFENQDRAEIEILEAKLKSTLTLLNQFLATGEWIVPTGPSQAGLDPQGHWMGELRPGWNGNYQLGNRSEHRGLVPGAEYAGTIYIDDEENPRLALQVSATATKLEAFNRGKDIIYVETYKDDLGNEKKRYWVGVDHVTKINPNDPQNIAIGANHLDHAIQIDFSRAYRISDGSNGAAYGTVGGFYIVGSDYRDDIIGSQGDDTIEGLKGSDTLSGMGGDDIIYGDDGEGWTRPSGQTIPDGEDLIDGGAGKDTLYGGGGIDKGFASDSLASGDVKNRIEDEVPNRGVRPPDEDWFDAAGTHGWTIGQEIAPGVVEVIENYDINSGEQNTLSLKMPDGFEMAFAENSGNDLKITLVKHKEGEPPQTFTILVKGALNPRLDSLKDPYLFNFSGNDEANIIDFHKVNFGNNVAHIKGAEEGDMIIAPQNFLMEDGLSLGDLLDPNNRVPMRETQKINKFVPGHDAEDSGIKAEVPEGKNEIEITRTDGGDNQKTLHIDPQDFDKAYVLVDPTNDQDMLVVLIKKGAEGSTPKTLVIRIKNYQDFYKKNAQGAREVNLGNLSWLQIEHTTRAQVGGTPPAEVKIDVIPLISVSMDANSDGTNEYYSGTILEGDEGEDFLFKAKEDLGLTGENIVEGHYTPPSSAPRTSNSGGSEPPSDDPDGENE